MSSTGYCAHGRPLAPSGRGQGCRYCLREWTADVASRPTPPEPEQLSLDAGRDRRDRGIAAATTSTGGKWDTSVVLQAIAALAASGRHFGADDVRHLLPSVGPKTIGAGFRVAARRGLITEVGTRQSRNASRHAGLVRTWRGTRTARPAGTMDHLGPTTKSTTGRPGLAPLRVVAAAHVTGVPSEDVTDKAGRLLASGRVQVRLLDPEGRVSALVVGDSARRHQVHRSRHGHWTCSCEAGHYRRACSHVAAVRLVVEPTAAQEGAA